MCRSKRNISKAYFSMWLRFFTIKNLCLGIFFDFKGIASQEIPLDSLVTLPIFFSNRKLQYQTTTEPTHLLATSAVGTQLMQDVPIETWGRGTKPMNATCKLKHQLQRWNNKGREEKWNSQSVSSLKLMCICECVCVRVYSVWGQR